MVIATQRHPTSEEKEPYDFLVEEPLRALFSALDSKGCGYITKREFFQNMKQEGILLTDPRMKSTLQLMDTIQSEKLTFNEFQDVVKGNRCLIEKALKGKFIIPNFRAFCETLETIFDKTKGIKEGALPDYIPQLARVDPENYGVSICTVDGQRFSIGNSKERFCAQSICKPINYCIALDTTSEAFVHKHVGREPSGRGFNELTLNNDGLPHNPMINSGAIMTSSLIHPELNIADRFDYVMEIWAELCGGKKPGFNNAVYLSEKQTADRNFALGYFMREKGSFPPKTDLLEVLDFYFQCCSIELSCELMAVAAASMGNGGICPLTEQCVLQPNTIKNSLSLLYSCGMYDFSGEWAFSVGLPAKSGVSGALMVIIPNIMGIAIWSPPLDSLGNSVRGVAFCKELLQRFNFHNYDSLLVHSDKEDPRLQKRQEAYEGVFALCYAASQGDTNEIIRLVAHGIDLNSTDYDERTPIHLACSEGHLHTVQYLVQQGVKTDGIDRWGNTPLADAIRGNHNQVVSFLKSLDC